MIIVTKTNKPLRAKQNFYKPSVVLLISIMFIVMISALIVKNLDDSNRFLNEASLGKSLVQTAVTIENLNKEALPFIKSYLGDDESMAMISAFPFRYGNVVTRISATPYAGIYDLVKIRNKKKLVYDDLIQAVGYEYDFLQILRSYPEINSHAQIRTFINDYVDKTGDEELLKMVELFTFFEADVENENEISSEVIYYNIVYHLDIANTQSIVKMVFNTKEDTIEDFVFLH